METRILQLELSMDAAKRDIEELKELLMNLTFIVNELNDKVNKLVNENQRINSECTKKRKGYP